MRYEKSEHLLRLALMMQATSEGIGLIDIQREFAVGRRTAERMRDALIMLFPHIEKIRVDGKTKRWRMRSNYITGLMHISAEDLVALRMAIEILQHKNLHHHADSLERIWFQIKGKLKPERASSIETDLEALLDAETYFTPEPSPHPIDKTTLSTLREAIKGYRKVAITYQPQEGREHQMLVIHPYGIVYGTQHTLLAHNESSDTIEPFIIDKIRSTNILDVCYQRQENFMLRDYVQTCCCENNIL